ncbi:MAG: hypothetical protein KIT10_05405 [Flavobacteriales bacterium]|nr:hypothetical protein [Flavobacteriales bacterium]
MMNRLITAALISATAFTVQAQSLTPASQERTRPTQDAQVKQERAAAAATATDANNQPVQAQGADRISRLVQELGLTPEQEKGLRAAQEKRDNQMNDLRSTPGLDRTQQGTRGDAILAEHDAHVRTILTPEQYEKYQSSLRVRRVEAAPEQMRERPAAAPENR